MTAWAQVGSRADRVCPAKDSLEGEEAPGEPSGGPGVQGRSGGPWLPGRRFLNRSQID